MSKQFRWIGVLTLLLMLPGSQFMAQGAVSIVSATVDLKHTQLVVRGANFGPTARVFLANVELTGVNVEPGGEVLSALLEPGIEPGSYLLQVSLGSAATDNAWFVLALGGALETRLLMEVGTHDLAPAPTSNVATASLGTANQEVQIYESHDLGNQNTAVGVTALGALTTGTDNTALGAAALSNNTEGNRNIAIGSGAGNNVTTGSNNILIGHVGVAGEANVIRIGDGLTQADTYLTGVIHGDGSGLTGVVQQDTVTNDVTITGDLTVAGSLTSGGRSVATAGANTFSAMQTLQVGAVIQGITAGTGPGVDVTTNSVFGRDALAANTDGNNNSAAGYRALRATTSGSGNSANGSRALESNTTGNSNTAHGYRALQFNTTGSGNTAQGDSALFSNTTGFGNTAQGDIALTTNTTGHANTAQGYAALYSNGGGSANVATGQAALYRNTTGSSNSAHGDAALYHNVHGWGNSAYGYNSQSSATGYHNTSVGDRSLVNTTGNYNVAIGTFAGLSVWSGSNNVFVGTDAGNHPLQLSSAVNSMVLGAGAYSTASNQIVIGNANVVTTLLSGKVGIGTRTPQQLLDVSGTARFTGTGGFSIGRDLGNAHIAADHAGDQRFGVVNGDGTFSGLRTRAVSIGSNFAGITAPSNGLLVEGATALGLATASHTLSVGGSGLAVYGAYVNTSNYAAATLTASTERVQLAAISGEGDTATLDIALKPSGEGFVIVGRVIGSAPAPSLCDSEDEANRLRFDSTNDIFWICSGASGWRKLVTLAPEE